ncbi:GNAT family N-acetyltransferase [Pseudomonas cremoricolorata]|uniref:GNAT family N-acetyltransferase n=1 Tax=Pseudomonas cremoricolorata TaxID=157783 RepID=UPI00041DC5E0|nr:GNAT family N-acetyltransferase [Pseudomonas cremoricolorata]
MAHYRYEPLAQAHRRLLQQFYRAHGSAMRPSGEAQLWVARGPQIIAGLSLAALAEGHWLTGLFVDPARRGQGIARALIGAAQAHSQGPTWLFCDPDLQGFYEGLGFAMAGTLPEALNSRLQRYQRSKALVALHHPGA